MPEVWQPDEIIVGDMITGDAYIIKFMKEGKTQNAYVLDARAVKFIADAMNGIIRDYDL